MRDKVRSTAIRNDVVNRDALLVIHDELKSRGTSLLEDDVLNGITHSLVPVPIAHTYETLTHEVRMRAPCAEAASELPATDDTRFVLVPDDRHASVQVRVPDVFAEVSHVRLVLTAAMRVTRRSKHCFADNACTAFSRTGSAA